MKLLENYEKAKQELYNHVGFEEDWVVCPIDFQTDMVWGVDGDNRIVRFAANKENFENIESGEYYEDELYTQRFYRKWVYEGELFTLVMCDPHVDGMKWFRIFDNSKRVEIVE